MSILARAYNGSFDSAPFMCITPLVSPPSAQDATDYHVPGTDTNLSIDLGATLQIWDQNVAVDASDLSTLEGKVGNTASYVYFRGTLSSVWLRSITTPVKAPGFPTYSLTLHLSVGS